MHEPSQISIELVLSEGSVYGISDGASNSLRAGNDFLCREIRDLPANVFRPRHDRIRSEVANPVGLLQKFSDYSSKIKYLISLLELDSLSSF